MAVVVVISYDDTDGVGVIHATDIRSPNPTNFLCAIIVQKRPLVKPNFSGDGQLRENVQLSMGVKPIVPH